ncbi:dTDP-4-dehydrorhamnose 3,5-epimerase [Enterobacter hormaechei]|uniref:dTDP-4-dehydrorhamnose 3,5-epimerase n=2 Tax=Enterobacter cloacae complex TaxID=354276 RepID=A0A6B9XWE6_ENTCL|nr:MULTISPECIES: dTDP-4-dehydrorhamnose 3,5-epimerase [Enterobacter cloacae complex]MBT1858868.1 dTDP-4-dehydrorhamnose 3,5-epimerase [Enterobacter hormaechei subsp. xiangfangensis]HED2221223.1 dTDP-4-dehydrorhamnose 3,5-epimerase [Enterobacter hormaechei subsp. steigerwaltii]AXO39848.1 dTDP-4-dehydrorhamnose 3,5-epimerase [Enterobacter hormaechei]EHN8909666.1 dTDP-4-dehydrorhamnose 3,5-epimerase [Enterobacter hormaechei]EKJ6980299.1 dTDP-4-dehydrorhamnose 3,5-epimerase [Enterobacter hormaeche
MNVVKTDIPDVLIFEPKVFGDERGFFFESFSQKVFEEAVGRKIEFVQDNHSKSCKGVLRGLHLQTEPYAQGKLVRCVVGEVFDVAVDLRERSLTFGKWIGVNLSAQNKKQLWIPEGFAHGFLTMTEYAEFVYKTSSYYAPHSEMSIKYDDPDIGIVWPSLDDIVLSKKDEKGISLRNYSEVMKNNL